MFKSVAELQQFMKDKGIRMVDFKMVDIDGRWRHLSIPVERFTEKTMVDGIGFDGSNYGYAPVEKSDMVFVPNLDTAMVDEYVEIPTLTMMGDVYVIGEEENVLAVYVNAEPVGVVHPPVVDPSCQYARTKR